MTAHLIEVEDSAARQGVSRFQTQMEIVVLSLLNPDRGVALIQIREAETTSFEHVDGLASGALSADEATKARRVARAMLQYSFKRILMMVESQSDDDFSSAKDAGTSSGGVN